MKLILRFEPTLFLRDDQFPNWRPSLFEGATMLRHLLRLCRIPDTRGFSFMHNRNNHNTVDIIYDTTATTDGEFKVPRILTTMIVILAARGIFGTLYVREEQKEIML